MSFREAEPEAHCYRCELAVNGECAEFKALNPQYVGGYDRKGCSWGSKHQLRMVLLDKDGKTVYDSGEFLAKTQQKEERPHSVLSSNSPHEEEESK